MENDRVQETIERIKNRPVYLSPWLRLLIGVGAAVLASGLGFLAPFLGWLAGLGLFLPVLLGLVVYGSADVIGFAAYILLYEAALFYFGGPLTAVCALLFAVSPMAIMIRLEIKGKPAFYDRLYVSLAVMLAGMVAALAFLAFIYNGRLADLAGKALKNSFNSLDAQTRQGIASLYEQIYRTMGFEVGTDSEQILDSIVDIAKEVFKSSMPAMLLILSVLNVFPGVLLCSFIRTRRRLPGAAYQPVMALRMPARYVYGLLILLVAGFILNYTGEAGGVVLTTVLTALSIACILQYIASITDRLSKSPMSRGVKIIMFIANTFLLSYILPLYGLLSMLIGSKGIITARLRAHRDKGTDI